MFWAAFSGSPRKTGLIPLFGNPESAREGVDRFVIEALYRRILPTLLAEPDSIFQHDNAPTHTAYVVRDALNELGFEIMEWPPYSPDLNPIENLWALLKAKVMEIRPDLRHMPNNESTWEILVDTAQEAWDRLDLAIFMNLSESMPHRVQDIIKYEGWYTSYYVAVIGNMRFCRRKSMTNSGSRKGRSTGVQILLQCVGRRRHKTDTIPKVGRTHES